jgi:hypothetical protein
VQFYVYCLIFIAVNALEKFWCENHFTCFGCDTQLTLRLVFISTLTRINYQKDQCETRVQLSGDVKVFATKHKHKISSYKYQTVFP